MRPTHELRNISEIRTFFRTNEDPVYFVGPTGFNLLGLNRWVRNFSYISFFDPFDGMHPRLRQVPPSVASRSIMATRLPSSAARNAVEYPPGPPPIIAMSKASLMSDSFVLVPKPSPS